MNFEIIKNSDDVKDLNAEQYAMLELFMDMNHFDLCDKVFLFETIHGHIAEIEKKSFNKLLAHKTARLDQNDLRVLAAISQFTRWIEVTQGSIMIAF